MSSAAEAAPSWADIVEEDLTTDIRPQNTEAGSSPAMDLYWVLLVAMAVSRFVYWSVNLPQSRPCLPFEVSSRRSVACVRSDSQARTNAVGRIGELDGIQPDV